MIRYIGPSRACFSRPGWWQTLCGLDSANQGFGWSDKTSLVGCKSCKKLIKKKKHYIQVRKLSDYLVPK